MPLPFRDRRDAGRQLAARLRQWAQRTDVLVLGLPRGGVPVAAEVAAAIQAPLDVFLVRKLGVPGHEELAMGAIASGDVRVLDEVLIDELRIPGDAIAAVEAQERRELTRRERLYRGTRAAPDVQGRTVILVDDGLATGSTMRAAATALRNLEPAWIVAAVPVGSARVVSDLEDVVDELVCAETPEPFFAVGAWYDDFRPTPDEEVQNLLRRAEERLASADRVQVATADPAVEAIRRVARPLTGMTSDYDELLGTIGSARLVLLGEASHGTGEFYFERALLTQRLIAEKGFAAVVVEADWPDAYRVNRYVRGESNDPGADAALGAFHRFPRWMWRNTEIRRFVDWLRQFNQSRSTPGERAGFYGMDLYSLHASVEAVIGYLEKVDPAGAARARSRYACFDHFGDEPQAYGYATVLGLAEPCENEVVGQLVEMQRRAADLATRDGRVAADEFFFAEQNARLAKNAEAYYRAMFSGRVASWNLRDRHMVETIDALIPHLKQHGYGSKLVVWAHNSHLGDARATDMALAGELNVGQLARERYGSATFSVGFTTHTGTVTAAADWDGPAKQRHVRPGLPQSYEALFHETALGNFWLPCASEDLEGHLFAPRLERAIGVVYRPETERFSHYFRARIGHQFDAVIHLDVTHALEPLDRDPGWEELDELPETYPFGV